MSDASLLRVRRMLELWERDKTLDYADKHGFDAPPINLTPAEARALLALLREAEP